MKVLSLREKRKQKFAMVYANMYFDKINGATWEELAKKYKYKNAESARQTYYFCAVRTIKSMNDKNTLDK